MKNRILLLTSLLLLGFLPSLFSQNRGKSSDKLSLENVFANPPASTKPHVYWYWISNNISKEGIRKDLEALARTSIGMVTFRWSISRMKMPKPTPNGRGIGCPRKQNGSGRHVLAPRNYLANTISLTVPTHGKVYSPWPMPVKMAFQALRLWAAMRPMPTDCST